MGVSVIHGTNDKPVASRSLAELALAWSDWTGKLFIGYPIVGTTQGPHRIDALLVSAERGLIVFDLIEGNELEGFEKRQDDAANLVDAKLRTHSDLTHKRKLLINIHTISFAPSATPAMLRSLPCDDYEVTNREGLVGTIREFNWPEKDERVFRKALSTLEHITTIRKTRIRRPERDHSTRGAKLRALEDSVATLDTMQSRAVIETVNGIQRIRGLAGSGKTIVLALKAAYLHAQHPEWRMAVTFQTRSLKDYFRRLIGDFCVAQTNESPDWDRLRVLNAWGAPGGGEQDGIYHEFCESHGLRYFDFLAARRQFGRGREFERACDHALRHAQPAIPSYDAILVDEAQDLPPAFLRVCYSLLKENKRIVYAYDELQNLSSEPLPSPITIFGEGARWDSEADRRDIILAKCYRNSRPVLATAHALGFGVYRSPGPGQSSGLVQMFDEPKLWDEVGYRVSSGSLVGGSLVTLQRTRDTSPRFLETHSPVDDLLRFERFDTEAQQAQWVVQEIRKNIEDDQLLPEDIIVIHLNPISTRKKLGPIRRRLLDTGIQAHLAGVHTHRDVFFQRGSVTFTGIHRAKGNEVPMVYVIDAQDCWSSPINLATIRNRLFTAITRSKAWVRVCGIGEGMAALTDEYQMLARSDYQLRFRYPTEQELAKMRIVHRDLTSAEGRLVSGHKMNVSKLIADLEAGNLYAEDFGEDIADKLRTLLMVREARRARDDSQ